MDADWKSKAGRFGVPSHSARSAALGMVAEQPTKRSGRVSCDDPTSDWVIGRQRMKCKQTK